MWIYHKDDINILDINEVGEHELSRRCHCNPKITEFNSKTLIIHTCAHLIDEQTKRLFLKDANS